MEPHTRWLIRRDMPEVLDIESEAFEARWTEDDYLAILRERNCVGMVAEIDQHVVGVLIYRLFKSWLEIERVGVLPRWQRHGIGRQFLEKLKAKMSHKRRKRVFFSVPGGNLESHLWLKACDFQCVRTNGDEYQFSHHLDGNPVIVRPSIPLRLRGVKTPPPREFSQWQDSETDEDFDGEAV